MAVARQASARADSTAAQNEVLTSSLPSLDGLRVLVVMMNHAVADCAGTVQTEVTAVATVAEAIEACNGCSQMYW